MTTTDHRLRWIAIVGACASVAMTCAATAMLLLNGLPLFDGFSPLLIIAGTVYATIGGLIAMRLPGNRIGWVILAGSLFWAVAFFTEQYAWFATVTLDGALPLALPMAWVQTWIWIPGEVLLLVAMPLLFPDGRLPSPRWRWLAMFIAVGTVMTMVSQAIGLLPHGETPATYLVEPQDGTTLPGLIGLVTLVGQLVTGVVGPLAATAAIILRLRRSVGIERQQMRWFAYAVAVTVVGIVLDELVLRETVFGQGLVSTLGIALIPIALGVSMFRYRLYEIDRIISRTASYAIVTVTLALVFVTVVLGPTTVLESVTGGDTLAVAASTLVVAALFQPLRQRMQRVVDRRFDRARYDAERTLTAFGTRLRDDVDLGSIRGDLLGVIGNSLQPTSVGIWMREQPGGLE